MENQNLILDYIKNSKVLQNSIIHISFIFFTVICIIILRLIYVQIYKNKEKIHQSDNSSIITIKNALNKN